MNRSLVIARRVSLFICLVTVAACASKAGGAPGSGGGRGGRGGADAGPVPVVVASVTEKDVPISVAAIGNVEASSSVDVRAQVTGVITGVQFNEGDFVKKGDPLFNIDQRPLTASLQQAEANLMRDQALLAQAEAELTRDMANETYSHADTERQNALVARGLLARDQGDQAAASAAAAAATVTADRAGIQSAKATLDAQQATVDNARLQLAYTTIRSPISGRTGNVMLKTGNLVAADATSLVTITQLDPVYVTFSVPAVYLSEIKLHAADGLEVSATPQDANTESTTGTLSFIDNAVDPATDTIKLKATFSNGDRALWPGQFARVSLHVSTLTNVQVVPAQAVQTGQDGSFVFVVKKDSTVEQRAVTTGPTVDQDVVIQRGLKPGETVVTEGQLRLESGTKTVRADPRTGEAAPTGGRSGASRNGGARGGPQRSGTAGSAGGQ